MKTKRKHLVAFLSLLMVAFMLLPGFALPGNSYIYVSGNMLETTSINYGSPCNVTGVVHFARGASYITGNIFCIDGRQAQYGYMWRPESANITSVDLKYTELNNRMRFDILLPGRYIFQIVAVDNMGNKITENTGFTVGYTSSNAYWFIERMYSVCFNRDASPDEIRSWSKRLASGQLTAATVAKGFFESNEFLGHHYSNYDFVMRLYNALLLRNPDGDGYNNWMRHLQNGMYRHEVLRGFVNSPEFGEICRKYGFVQGYLY